MLYVQQRVHGYHIWRLLVLFHDLLSRKIAFCQCVQYSLPGCAIREGGRQAGEQAHDFGDEVGRTQGYALLHGELVSRADKLIGQAQVQVEVAPALLWR